MAQPHAPCASVPALRRNACSLAGGIALAAAAMAPAPRGGAERARCRPGRGGRVATVLLARVPRVPARRQHRRDVRAPAAALGRFVLRVQLSRAGRGRRVCHRLAPRVRLRDPRPGAVHRAGRFRRGLRPRRAGRGRSVVVLQPRGPCTGDGPLAAKSARFGAGRSRAARYRDGGVPHPSGDRPVSRRWRANARGFLRECVADRLVRCRSGRRFRHPLVHRVRRRGHSGRRNAATRGATCRWRSAARSRSAGCSTSSPSPRWRAAI